LKFQCEKNGDVAEWKWDRTSLQRKETTKKNGDKKEFDTNQQ